MIRIVAAIVFVLLFAGGANSQDLSIKDQITLKTVLTYHKNNLECDGRGSDMESSEFIRFKKNSDYEEDTIIVLVSCSFHAYQVSWVAYSTGDGPDEEISVLSFPGTNDGKQWTASKFLMSPNWDTKTKILSTFYKGRGIADCGSYDSFKWNGYSFYLNTANYQVCCWDEEAFEKKSACKKIKDDYPLGTEDWPLVYQYKAE